MIRVVCMIPGNIRLVQRDDGNVEFQVWCDDGPDRQRWETSSHSGSGKTVGSITGLFLLRVSQLLTRLESEPPFFAEDEKREMVSPEQKEFTDTLVAAAYLVVDPYRPETLEKRVYHLKCVLDELEVTAKARIHTGR